MQHSQSRLQSVPWFDVFMSVLLASFLAAGLITGYLFYQSIRHFVASANMPILPDLSSLSRIPLSAPDPAEAATELDTLPTRAPGVADDISEEPAPNISEPVTVLVMGIDKRRDEDTGAWRTDTMILARIDPTTGEAAMLSIPRDLFLMLPDYGYGAHTSRINTANVYGEIYDYPGGGPALAKRTIYKNFGVEVDRYAIIDFDGFRKIVDHIGGIEVDVPNRIVDRLYPTEDYGYQTVVFEEGHEHMDGERALIYARTRKSSSDFARAERQQQVIMAIRDRVLSLDIIPTLTPANLLELINTVGSSVQTDLAPEEIWALAKIAREVDDDDISRAVIDISYVYPAVNSDGSEVLLPRWDKIVPLLEEDLGFEVEEEVAAPSIPRPPTPTPTATPEITGTMSITETAEVTSTVTP